MPSFWSRGVMAMNIRSSSKLYLYQLSVVFSVIFALAGFSYNVWRMEVSEQNNTIRTACFEILVKLSSLEQLIYTAHYDNDLIAGSPRKGWVMVGLISDLSTLTDASVQKKSTALKAAWSANWETMVSNSDSVETLVTAIDAVRLEIKQLLNSLE